MFVSIPVGTKIGVPHLHMNLMLCVLFFGVVNILFNTNYSQAYNNKNEYYILIIGVCILFFKIFLFQFDLPMNE